jgi:hypothetical protein
MVEFKTNQIYLSANKSFSYFHLQCLQAYLLEVGKNGSVGGVVLLLFFIILIGFMANLLVSTTN